MNVVDDERELTTLRLLDELLCRAAIRAAIDPIASRVLAQLDADALAPLAWEPIPSGLYSGALPEFIRSSWVFALRGNSASGAERHPNSHQRVRSYRGVGDLQVFVDGAWRSHVLSDNPHAALLSRWASIPHNTWHQAVVTGPHWAVVSFHTVPDHELIEERPDSNRSDITHQRRYVGGRNDDTPPGERV